jgi:hypothetical protein
MSVFVTGDGTEYIKSIRVGNKSVVWAGGEVAWRELERIVVWKEGRLLDGRQGEPFHIGQLNTAGMTS